MTNIKHIKNVTHHKLMIFFIARDGQLWQCFIVYELVLKLGLSSWFLNFFKVGFVLGFIIGFGIDFGIGLE